MSVLIGFATAVRLAEEPEFNRDMVTPGLPGFIFTALIAVAVILLGLDLVRRLRRTRFRDEIREKLEAEIAERDAANDVANSGSNDGVNFGAHDEADIDVNSHTNSEVDPDSGDKP